MSWAKLLADNRVTALPPTGVELDNLRTIVAGTYEMWTPRGLSADAQFVMAYDAARTLSLLIVRASGHRPRTVGRHYNTFLALEVADPAFANLSTYFDGCRTKRNSCGLISRAACRIRMPRVCSLQCVSSRSTWKLGFEHVTRTSFKLNFSRIRDEVTAASAATQQPVFPRTKDQ